MARPADPVREGVEAALHRLVELVTTGPCGLLRTASRTFAESVGLARTLFNLTVDGVLGWEVDAGVPRLDTFDATAGATPPVVVRGSGEVGDVPLLAGNRPGAVDLAIPGYEDLAASHIVARLDRLSPSELAEIRSFEVANRGRRTVVGKIDRLLARS